MFDADIKAIPHDNDIVDDVNVAKIAFNARIFTECVLLFGMWCHLSNNVVLVPDQF